MFHRTDVELPRTNNSTERWQRNFNAQFSSIIQHFEKNLKREELLTPSLSDIIFKPPSISNIIFTSEIRNILTFYRSTYGNILLMGDFNMTPNNPKLSELIDDHEFFTLISEPTCFKSINPTCIDNFLTNKKTRFMKTLTFETGVSDHHKFIGTMLRSTFAKGKPKKMFYRNR